MWSSVYCIFSIVAIFPVVVSVSTRDRECRSQTNDSIEETSDIICSAEGLIIFADLLTLLFGVRVIRSQVDLVFGALHWMSHNLDEIK